MKPAVRIVEVGARDGLQNEQAIIATADKIALLDRLSATGLQSIEATSFVSPKWVPQLADAAEVFAGIARKPGVHYPVLVPNERGYERALAVGVEEIAVFTAASEAFNQKNINASIAESLARFEPVMARARADGIRVRGYVSTVLGCPYQGEVPVADVVRVSRVLHAMGCYEVSLGTDLPTKATDVVAVVDAAVAAVGGCPYARGASGNLASEDVVYMLHGLGVHTGIDLPQLAETGRWLATLLGRQTGSKVGRALSS